MKYYHYHFQYKFIVKPFYLHVSESPTRDLFPAPTCQHSQSNVRLYDNTCRCSRGNTAVDIDTRGRTRGNCTGLDDDTRDNLDKVWCFLENIRDPLNPQSGCYPDVTWSEKDGRFWSSRACFEVSHIVKIKLLFSQISKSNKSGSGY